MISSYDNFHGDEGYEWEKCSLYYINKYRENYDIDEYDEAHINDDTCNED